jgi:hypothetical protein
MESIVKLTLFLPPQPLPISERPAAEPEAAVVGEWTDPRYESLAAAWDTLQPPLGTIGFLAPEP